MQTDVTKSHLYLSIFYELLKIRSYKQSLLIFMSTQEGCSQQCVGASSFGFQLWGEHRHEGHVDNLSHPYREHEMDSRNLIEQTRCGYSTLAVLIYSISLCLLRPRLSKCSRISPGSERMPNFVIPFKKCGFKRFQYSHLFNWHGEDSDVPLTTDMTAWLASKYSKWR